MDEGRDLNWREWGFIAAIGFGILLNALGVFKTLPGTNLDTAVLLTAVGGWRIFYESFSELLIHRRIGADLAVSIAAIAALLIGEYLAAAEVIFIMLIGGALEHYAVVKTHSALEQLLELAPKTARILRNGEESEVPIEQVQVGEIVVVRPGERIPVDGVVISGRSSVNQAPLTGESVPVEKSEGDEVFAGTLNEFGVLTIRTTRVGNETKLGQIVQLVKEAQERKGKVQRLADKYAQWFVPVLLLVGGLTFLLSRFGLGLEAKQTWLRVVSVLVVACPCAMILATPTAVVAALGRLARSGILAKGGIYLEQLAEVDCIAFDKTGTLTEGKPKVQAIVPLGKRTEDEVLTLAAAAEQMSEHVFAKAILDEAKRRNLKIPPAEDFQAYPGMGLKATVGRTTVFVGSKGFITEQLGDIDETISEKLESLAQQGFTAVIVARSETFSELGQHPDSTPAPSTPHPAPKFQIVGIIALADQLRTEAKETIESLRATGIKHIVILTGDNASVAKRIAQQVGVDEVHFELLPQDKVAIVRQLQQQGRKVAMVGDGINDAPVLTAADVGIALGGIGMDVTIEAADIVLMTDDLSKLPEAVDVCRRTLNTIRQNLLLFAIGVNAVGVFAAGAGILKPIGAAVMHQVASLLVVLNSLRLLIYRTETKLHLWLKRASERWREFSSELAQTLPKVQDRIASHKRQFSVSACIAVFALWMLSGIYIVNHDEVAVVQLLGRVVSEDVPSGIHYRLPFPLTKLWKIRKHELRRVEIGFRTVPPLQRGQEPLVYEWDFPHKFGRYRKLPEESLMVTGDENLASVNTVVHYRVADTTDFLFRVANADELIRSVGERVIREVAAQVHLDSLLVSERRELERIVRERMQRLLSAYRAGVEIVAVKFQDVHPPIEVVDAFRMVAAAFEQKLATVNQAEAYRNEQIPLARGKAVEQVETAKAYRIRRSLHALGESQRFLMFSEVYRNFPEVTRVRLYLEAIEKALAGKPKIIMDARSIARRQMLFVDEKGLSLTLGEALQALTQQAQQPQQETVVPEH
jgi:Cu+-exporting ATPase